MRVEIWSDVVCPWCFVGKRRFESALSSFEHRDEVEVLWRAFELDPGAPALREGDYAGRLAAKYRLPREQAEAMMERMTRVGAEVGADLRFDRARPGNTFDAHRLLHLALDRGMQDALQERLLVATWTEGRPIGLAGTLRELAVEAGLDGEEAAAVLAGDRYASEVRADELLARSLGISAVPFFAFDRAFGVPGAQHPDVLLDVLRQAWHDRRGEGAGPGAAGECSDDACAV